MKLIEFFKMEQKWIIPTMTAIFLLVTSLSAYILYQTPSEQRGFDSDIRDSGNNSFLEIHNSKVERLQELLEDAEIRIDSLRYKPASIIIIPIENTDKIKLLQEQLDSANAEIALLKVSVLAAVIKPVSEPNAVAECAPAGILETVYVPDLAIKNSPKQNILHRIMQTGEPYSVAYRNAQIGR